MGTKASKLLYLNTSVSGADVAGTVVNYPVLVRLHANNFDFRQAKEDGCDIRFAKADGTSLPYELERWDAATRRAEVWVNVDTVYGNNDTQSIIMYWGNHGASDSSNVARSADWIKLCFMNQREDNKLLVFNSYNYSTLNVLAH